MTLSPQKRMKEKIEESKDLLDAENLKYKVHAPITPVPMQISANQHD